MDAVDAEVARLNNQITVLAGEKYNLHAENSRLRQSVDGLQREVQTARIEAQRKKDRADKLEDELLNERARIVNLKEALEASEYGEAKLRETNAKQSARLKKYENAAMHVTNDSVRGTVLGDAIYGVGGGAVRDKWVKLLRGAGEES